MGKRGLVAAAPAGLPVAMEAVAAAGKGGAKDGDDATIDLVI